MVKLSVPTARGRLADVPGDKQFWCHDGRFIQSLEELAAALEQMSDETFHAHSNETKSDFSVWVRDVIGEEKLARDLLKSTSRKQAAKAVSDRIKWLKGKTA